jgi:hypothetical protein
VDVAAWMLAGLVAAIVGGCSGSDRAVAAPVAPPTPPPPAAPGGGPELPTAAPAPFDRLLADFASATAIHITSGWMGLSPIAPIEHRIDVTFAGAEVTTHTVCGAALQTQERPDTTLPAAPFTAALSRLASVTIRPGPYQARVTHTDDYPDLTIVVDTPSGSVTYHSASQGELAIPWEISAEGGSGVISDRVPGEVFTDLTERLGVRECETWAQSVRRSH